MAWYFDESDATQYVTVADNAALTLPSGGWTIGAWVALVDGNAGSAYKYWLSWGSFEADPSVNIYVTEATADVPDVHSCVSRSAAAANTERAARTAGCMTWA